MHHFWDRIIRPILQSISAKTIVEIGVKDGATTEHILAYAQEHQAIVHGIDPHRTPAVDALLERFPQQFQFHEKLSLHALTTIESCDAVLIDGDHNWFTVYHELLLLEKMANHTHRFPVVFLHDVLWPYGKRDAYSNPELIPIASQQPYKQGGLRLNQAEPLPGHGFNKTVFHAIYEHDIQNGVQSAVDDFIQQSRWNLEYRVVPGFHGLGILLPQITLNTNPDLQSLLQTTYCAPPIFDLINTLDHKKLEAEIHILNMEEEKRVLENRMIMQRTERDKALSKTTMLNNKNAELQHRISTLQQEHDQLSTQVQHLASENTAYKTHHYTLQNELIGLQKHVRQQTMETRAVELRYTELKRQSEILQKQLENAQQAKTELNHVLLSRSWRCTAWLRRIDAQLQSIRNGTYMYTVFNNLKDLWTDFGEPFPGLARYIRHSLLGKRWPAQETDAPHIAYTAQAYSPQSFLSMHDIVRSKASVKRMSFTPYVHIVIVIRSFDEILLRRCLNSVAEQTYDEWGVCVVDVSGSTRIVAAITEEYNTSYAQEFSFIASSSTEDARLTALQSCKGQYVCILPDTDTMQPDTFECCMNRALEQAELPDLIYSDHDQILTPETQQYEPVYKPGWSPELLLSYNYIGTAFLVRREVLIDCLPAELPKSAYIYDIVLRITEAQQHVVHIPRVLFHHYDGISRSSEYSLAAEAILNAALRRRGLPHAIQRHPASKNSTDVFFRIAYHLPPASCPKVSILIPTKDRIDLLQQCLESLRTTTYPNIEVLIINNNSELQETETYLQSIPERSIRIDTPAFNFAHINNVAATHTTGEYILLLNNDTIIVDPQWLHELVGVFTLDEHIGVVGSKLLYPKRQPGKRVQSVGMIVGRHWASLVQFDTEEEPGYGNYNHVMRNCSAIGGACLLTKRSLFERVGGLDEQKFRIDFADVDYCLRLQQEGYRTVVAPSSVIVHDESATRGNNGGKGASVEREEIWAFEHKWSHLFGKDPYYNPHFTLTIQDNAFTLRQPEES